MSEPRTWGEVYRLKIAENRTPTEAAHFADDWLNKKEDKEKRMVKEFMNTLTQGCGTCTYDESEGELMRHCDKCALNVTTKAYELFVVNKASIGL